MTLLQKVQQQDPKKGVREPALVMDNDTAKIDDSLWFATCNFQHLNVTEKAIENLDSEMKQKEDTLKSTLQKEFSRLISALHLRKVTLQAEISEKVRQNRDELRRALRIIQEKKAFLDTNIKFAQEFKQAASKTACLDQVINNLNLRVEDGCLNVNGLKLRQSLSLQMNSDELICFIEKLGQIDVEKNKSGCLLGESGDPGQSIHLPSNQTELSEWGTYLSLERSGTEPAVKDFQTIPQEACMMYKDIKNTYPQEVASSAFQKNVTALPQALCNPDVIIEEIIEDGQEFYYSECIKEKKKHKKSPLRKVSQPFGARGSAQELVFVSHVVNPCNFYVQRYSQKKTLVMLGSHLETFCKQSAVLSSTSVLTLGERIIVKSKAQGSWCRGTVTELIPLECKNVGKPCGPTKYEINDISVMKVFLFDFGSSEVFVTGISGPHTMKPEYYNIQHLLVKDLRPVIRKLDPLMEAQMRNTPPLAILCSLKDILPQNSEGVWGEEVKEEFVRMVNNKAVLMKVFKEEEDGKLIVDLKKPTSDKISSDMPVSLRDALVFMELARFRSQLPGIQTENDVMLQYCPPVLPQLMKEVAVIICHVNSPSDFYIQLVDTLEYLMLMKKIQEVYNNGDCENLEIICPIKGQACIAMFEDEQWYRAEVVGLPGHREVEVKYVDFGNVAKVNVKKLRKIKDDFLNIPQKGIWCKLAYIEPSKNATEWSREATAKFEAMTSSRRMICTVISILPDNMLSVELFDSEETPGKLTPSVNTKLVKENMACYIPGEAPYLPYNEIWDPALDMTIDQTPDFSSLNFEEDMDFTHSKEELEVRVSYVSSPSKISVQWLSSGHLLKSLQDKMAETYKKSKPETIRWEIGMFCAVEIPILKQWRRGQIIKIVSETFVEVICYDYGIQEIVNVCHLRLLKDSLNMIGKLSLECSLMDIRPAGGSEKWTATACDFLSHYLNGAVVSMVVEENTSGLPLPVKISCKDEAGQIIDISEYLIKKGLALRKRRNDADGYSDITVENKDPPLNEMSDDYQPEQEIAMCHSEYKMERIEQLQCEPVLDEPYKPLSITTNKTFHATVSYVGDDGIISVIPKSLESELNKLMDDIQNNFKCLGMLEPYCWKKGEACAIRGSDTMWYRGKVLEVLGGTVRVQYLDHGYIEKIPHCHLYPTVLQADVPQFCVPCQLHKTLPVGDIWQPDAVELLRELLTKRCVEVNVEELPQHPLSVRIYCDNLSVSDFMEQHKHCILKILINTHNYQMGFVKGRSTSSHIAKLVTAISICTTQDIPAIAIGFDSEKTFHRELMDYNDGYMENEWQNSFEDLLLPGFLTPFLPRYTLPSLPYPGQLFPVTVKHIETPNTVFICLDSRDAVNQFTDTDSGVSCESEADALDLDMRRCNENIEALIPLTDFRSEMPCLATYNDDMLYRAKLVSVKNFDPVCILVQHIDFGSTETLPLSRLFQIPANLVQYPARGIRVKLAGFKPPLEDGETDRLPYSPEWSFEAMWEMMDLVHGKQLHASTLTRSPEPTIFLYEDERYLVHLPLIEKGLADLDD
ncbi:RING finger protein 17 [Rhinatrema bivittatum]|uniref:RING finger protein 17 n=1 Tax=Rhinatrema bivittatum TaxID=194408 RepID=UPI00112609D7|nr:RING finger protein 17 [Rhinatrema bivittatum]